MTKPSRSRLLKLLLLVVLVLIIVGVVWRLWPHGQSAGAMRGPGGPGGPGMMMGGGATPVHSGAATQADVPVYLNALGTVTPNATVTVTSRVDGQLMKIYFTEGQKVEAGQLLAQIDPRSYQATLAQYQAELSENQALLKSAQLTLARYKKLFAQDSLSRQDLETQMATVGQYSGAIKADEAQIAAAKLNIEYARITAPVSGRVGLRLVDAGNMVTSGDSTGIVTITQTQPVAVTFSVPQSNLPVLLKSLHNGQSMPVTAFDQDNKTALAEGKAQFISNSIDISTGTVQLKALFDNEDETLYANQFVNVRLQTGTLPQATVIPSQALQLSSDGSFVFVINQDHSVTRREVSTGPVFGEDQRAIISGIAPGEQVVTEGVDRLTNGSKVSVVTAQQKQTSAAGGSARAQ